MYLFGGDFYFMDAYELYSSLEKLIEIGNRYNKQNITFVMSTPGRYVDALKKENVTWPIKYGDFLNYYAFADTHGGPIDFWTGYYSSRPDFKKHTKDASAQFYSQSKLYSRMVIDQKLNENDVIAVLNATDVLLDSLSIVQHHDAVAGTASQYVTDDYQTRLKKAQDLSEAQTKDQVVKAMREYAGLVVSNETSVMRCIGSQNDTVADCPVASHTDKEFIVAVQNT